MVVRAAGLVIFHRVNKIVIEYLLMQASYGSHHWTPPKGHVDPGESDMETALRETEEEAGIKASDLNIIEGFKKVLEYPVKGKPKVVVYWLAELKNNSPVTLSKEHQAYEWLPLDEACRKAEYPEMQELLRDSDAYIKSYMLI